MRSTKKFLLSIVSTVFLTGACFGMTVLASDYDDGVRFGYDYIYTDDEITGLALSDYHGSSTETQISIPATQTITYTKYDESREEDVEVRKEVSVKAIGAYVFDGRKNITNVVLPDTVEEIGYSAFSGDVALKSINLPASLAIIGENAFSECKSLDNVILPDSVTSIQWNTFRDCMNLKSLRLPSNLIEIGGSAFCGCLSLQEIELPNSLVTLEYDAFQGCTSLKKITLPEKLATIGERAFADCTSLEEFIIKGNVISLSNDILSRCTNLKKLSLPKSLVTIGENILNDCAGLSEVTYAGTVEEWKKVIKSENNVLSSAIIKCSDGNYHEIHTASETFVVTKDPTCSEKGEKKYTCSLCGNERTEEINTIPHEYIEVVKKEATCSEKGVRSVECKVCGNVESTSEIATVPHEYIEKITKEATCSEKGAKSIECKFCGDVSRTEEIATIPHEYVEKITKEATCSQEGEKTTVCKVCENVDKIEKIDKLAHSNEKKTVKATATKDGYTQNKCKVCGTTGKKTVIYKASSIKLNKKAFVYNGKTNKAALTVKTSKGKTLKLNTDYTVKYTGNQKNVGKITVKVTFKGNYSGSKTLSYVIKPKSTEIRKLTSSKKKELKVDIKKQTAQTSGYVVMYGLKSNLSDGKKVTLSSNSKVSTVIKKLKSGKKYYVKVCTIKKIGKTTYTSSWSKVKNIKVK